MATFIYLMRKKFIIFLACALVGCMMVFLSWNTMELYRFKKDVAKEKVEGMISDAASVIQNRNGSLFNNFARSVFDKDFNSKMAFAAGFTHNASKVSVTFDDEEPVKPPYADTVPVIHADKEFFKKHNIVVRPDAEMTLFHFDSILRHDLDSLDIALPYRLTKFSRYDTAVGDTIFSDPFIINFAQPVMYRARYVLPQLYIQRQMLPYVASSLVLLLLLVGGFVFVYRAYSNNEKSVVFRQVLLGNFAHELKTPVTSLQLIVDGAEAQTSETGVTLSREHIGFAAIEIKRIRLLLDKMLSIGKMSKEGLEHNREILTVAELMYEATDAMSGSIEKTLGAITVDGGRALQVEGDRSLLVNVLTVLIDNAVKYGGTPPRIELEAYREKAAVAITVSDNGKGVPAEYRQRIFEPFFRVPTGDVHPVAGHGLGLSFAKEVVKLHDGYLDLMPVDGKTVFRIKLPAV